MRLSALGDVIHALPVLSALRARFPGARIDWAVEDRAAGLLQARSDLDRVLVFPRRRLSAAIRGVPRPLELWRTARGFTREMRGAAYDVALDLQGNLKSGAVTRLSGAGLPFGLARPAAREGNQLFTQRRALPPEGLRHRVERNLALASAMLGEDLPYVAPGFPTEAEDVSAAARLLEASGVSPAGYIVLHPGTSEFGAFKRWPAERYASLARALRAAGTEIVVTHGPGDEDLASDVVGAAGGGIARIGTPRLSVLAEVIRPAACFVAADTGPLHLAGLLEVPLVGLFGPKDPEIYGPYGVRTDGTPGLLPVLTQDDVACRPCTLRRCADPLCMRTMAPDRVHEAVQAAMS